MIDELIDSTLIKEGGFTSDPNDTAHQKRVAKGSKWDSYCTNHGVTQFTLSDVWGRQASIEEVRNLTKDDARRIFKKRYYLDARIDWLPDIMQPVVFDVSINSGPYRAVLLLQRLLRKAGYKVGSDGRIGRNTSEKCAAAVDKFGPLLVNAYIEERLTFYRRVIAYNPSQKRFLKNWTSRARSFVVPNAGEQVVNRLIEELS